MLFTARSELREVLFLEPSICGFLFVYEIFREPLNRFVPNLPIRRVRSLVWTSLKVKVKGQGHQGQKRHHHRQETVLLGPFLGLREVYVW